MKRLFILPIKGYQYLISPMLGNNCRHVPSCLQYMIEAIQLWGILRGTWLGTKRLLRCHPWGTSGYDPVPLKIQAHDHVLQEVRLQEGIEPALQFEKRGSIIPVVVQETSTGQILMMANANIAALELTIKIFCGISRPRNFSLIASAVTLVLFLTMVDSETFWMRVSR